MTNEERLLELVSKMYADLKSSQDKMYSDLKSSQDKMYAEMFEGFKAVNERLDKVENEVKDIKKTVLTIEQDHGSKITALFDGYAPRGDQTKQLQEHLDERLDAIHTDLSYVVGKTAQHDRKLIQLSKAK